jgi:nucleoside-diphosphate-sugar epimerase
MMKWLRAYLASRGRRGISARALGPNEARVLYDATVTLSAGILALILDIGLVRHGPPGLRLTLAVLALPPTVITASLALGIYGWLRSSSGSLKAAVLVLAVFASAVLAALISGDLAFAQLWLAIAGGPIIVARVLLGIAQTQRRTPLTVAANDRGPVLVIGGAGYIGTHAVEQLLERGHAVRVLDRLMYGRSSLEDFASNSRFEFVEGDAADISRLTEAMRGVSAVVHLAGLVGDPACAVDPEFTRHTNIVVTRMVRAIAQSMGVRRFVFASSCSVYGVSDDAVDELSPLNPVSLYAQTKIDSENELLSNAPDNFFITILRFATVFGHSRRPRFDLVGNLFAAQAIEDGVITVVGPNQWRPFIHVRDLGRAIAETINADPLLVQSQIFNVGDSRLNTTILELARTVQRVALAYRPVEITVTEDPLDKRNYAVSFTKIQRMLGFRAQTLLEDGIRELIDEHRGGAYSHYREEAYSNLAMTRRALERFHDPDELSRIYAPLAR